MDYKNYNRQEQAYHQKFDRYNQIKARVLQYYFKFYHRLEVTGLANIPDGPAILAPNHSGGLDLDLLAITFCAHPYRQITPLITEGWHFINHVWGKYVIGAGLPLWTEGGLNYDYFNPYLEKGGKFFPGLLCIFPEGNIQSYCKRHTVGKYFPGVVRLSLRYKVPVIPTALIGFAEANPALKIIPHKGKPDDILCLPFPLPLKLKIDFGEPIYLDEYYGMNLSKAEEYWVANEIISARHVRLLEKYYPIEVEPVDVPMKRPGR